MKHILIACVGAIAVAWWMGSKETSNPESTPPPPPQVERIDSPVEAAVPPPRSEEHRPAVAISPMYAALLEQLPPVTASRLQTLLADSEQVTDLALLAVREREISLLLSAEEYSLYEQLRESDAIQAHLQAFSNQVQTTSPLHPEQQRALLLAKLNHSTAAQLLVLDPELDQANIPAMERAYARDVAVAGIEHHERAFLAEVRPLLTTEQWAALAEFERASVDELLAPSNQTHSAASVEARASGLDNP